MRCREVATSQLLGAELAKFPFSFVRLFVALFGEKKNEALGPILRDEASNQPKTTHTMPRTKVLGRHLPKQCDDGLGGVNSSILELPEK